MLRRLRTAARISRGARMRATACRHARRFARARADTRARPRRRRTARRHFRSASRPQRRDTNRHDRSASRPQRRDTNRHDRRRGRSDAPRIAGVNPNPRRRPARHAALHAVGPRGVLETHGRRERDPRRGDAAVRRAHRPRPVARVALPGNLRARLARRGLPVPEPEIPPRRARGRARRGGDSSRRRPRDAAGRVGRVRDVSDARGRRRRLRRRARRGVAAGRGAMTVVNSEDVLGCRADLPGGCDAATPWGAAWIVRGRGDATGRGSSEDASRRRRWGARVESRRKWGFRHRKHAHAV